MTNPIVEQLIATPPAPTPDAPAPAPVAATPPVDASPAAEQAAPATTPPADAPVVGKFPDNWVDELAGGDEKRKNILSRFGSPKALADAYINANDKIRSGELKAPFPKDNPEAQARWREENGLPATPDAYDLTLPDGLVIGETDKPLVNDYLKIAHEQNIPPDAVKKMLGWYMGQTEKQVEILGKFDSDNAAKATQALKEEWGGKFEQNTNELSNAYKTFFGDEVADSIAQARLPDGRMLGDAPEIVRGMLSWARQANPLDHVLPGASNQMASLESEMATIEKKMGTTLYTERDAARYTELVGVRDKVKNPA